MPIKKYCLCVQLLDLTKTNNPTIKDVFVDFVHLTRTTGKKIGEAILTLLVKHGLQVMNIRGQSYDGAAAMASSKVGTQAQILAVNPLALYTHCKFYGFGKGV